MVTKPKINSFKTFSSAIVGYEGQDEQESAMANSDQERNSNHKSSGKNFTKNHQHKRKRHGKSRRKR